MEKKLEALEKMIGYTFQNQSLLQQALTHSSYANERKINKTEDYERLEFLGDAVLELAASEHIFESNPAMYEGNMTKIRASMVCEPTLAYCAREFGLERYILLGKGEELTGGRSRDSIVSDVLEAVIGAIYLDGGFANAKEFVRRFILEDMEHKVLFFDSKTILQERVQEAGKSAAYELLRESGPDHNKIYSVRVLVDGKDLGHGEGRTKKQAEQHAAYEALMKIDKAGGVCI